MDGNRKPHECWRSAGEIVNEITQSMPPEIDATAIARADGVILTDDPEQRIFAVKSYWMAWIGDADLTPETLLQFDALHARHPEWRDS